MTGLNRFREEHDHFGTSHAKRYIAELRAKKVYGQGGAAEIRNS